MVSVKPIIRQTKAYSKEEPSTRFRWSCSVPGSFKYGLGRSPQDAYQDWANLYKVRAPHSAPHGARL